VAATVHAVCATNARHLNWTRELVLCRCEDFKKCSRLIYWKATIHLLEKIYFKLRGRGVFRHAFMSSYESNFSLKARGCLRTYWNFDGYPPTIVSGVVFCPTSSSSSSRLFKKFSLLPGGYQELSKTLHTEPGRLPHTGRKQNKRSLSRFGKSIFFQFFGSLYQVRMICRKLDQSGQFSSIF
jgi:hypothetical protein